MSETYTKLFSSIIHSSVWREPLHVKVVWVTMLAMADRHGYVGSSIPGLADAAKVSLPQAEEALALFFAPDPYSRSEEFEGRRIEKADRGWTILNYGRFRDMRDEEVRKEYERTRKREQRATEKASRTNGDMSQVSRVVPESPAVSAQAEASAKAKADQTPDSSEPLRAAEPPAFKGMPLASATGETWDVPAELHRTWVPAFPGVNVEAEYRKAAAWLASNPTKRKTVRGMPKFMNGWLERAQNRGGSIPAQPARGAGARAAGALLFGVAK